MLKIDNIYAPLNINEPRKNLWKALVRPAGYPWNRRQCRIPSATIVMETTITDGKLVVHSTVLDDVGRLRYAHAHILEAA